MRSYALLVAAMLARTLAEPIPATKDAEEKQSAKTTESVEPTPTQSFVVVTIQTAPLTTTFVPPPSCTQSHLTMFKSQEFRIWLHEPMPLSNVTVGDCYPSQFIKGYTSLPGATSSVAPVMSPLVCPQGWHTAQDWGNGYIACCANEYGYRSPDSINPDRPAGGATCYSDITIGQSISFTLYEDSDEPVTRSTVVDLPSQQAFGHVIDGWALNYTPSSTSAETSMTGAPVGKQPGDSDDSSDSLSGGAIAGIVIGSIAGVALIIAAAFFFVRRRSQQNHEQLGLSRDQPSQQGSNMDYDSKPLPDVYAMKDHPVSPGSTGWTGADGRSETTTVTSPNMTVASPVSELGGLQRHELASTDYVELDSNQARHEVS